MGRVPNRHSLSYNSWSCSAVDDNGCLYSLYSAVDDDGYLYTYFTARRVLHDEVQRLLSLYDLEQLHDVRMVQHLHYPDLETIMTEC